MNSKRTLLFYSGSYKSWISIILFLGLFLSTSEVIGQTDFAPGEIMFTGYNSDAANSFSFVLLNSVVSGTVIYITDRGWSNSSGFRTDGDASGEGTIELTFTGDFPCGTQIFFTDVGGSNDWIGPVNSTGTVVGTVVLTLTGNGDVDGPELSTSGDQLFIYQNPIPVFNNQANFITMIQMDLPFTNATNDNNSAKPNGLSNAQIVRFNVEFDDAKYNCVPNSGTGTFLQSAISNDGSGPFSPDGENNWTESDALITLMPGCSFCCGTTPVTPSLSGFTQVSTNQMFTITISGALTPGFVWQLFTAGCGSGTPLQTTSGNTFTVTAPGSPGTVTYYVRSSQSLTCPANCATLTVCVESDPLALCSDCFADTNLCGNCYLPDPFHNPDLNSGCYEIKLIFILDESGSIGFPINYEPAVKAGVLAFLNALNGQNILASMIEFSDLGRIVNTYTVINDSYIANITNYFDNIPNNMSPYMNQIYIPGGGTNWHDAMKKADALDPPTDPPDLILFFTDGEPTEYTNANGNGVGCPTNSTHAPEIVNAARIANKLKAEGTHMFMLGVGDEVNVQNLEFMSGYTAYQSGVNTMGTSDYSIGQFASLATDLQNFVEELCNTIIQITKTVVGPICNGIVQFRFIVTNLGSESAASTVIVRDTFPATYSNLAFNGPPSVKICPFIINPCPLPQPANSFVWFTQPIPPLESDTLIISATVGAGPYNNFYNNRVWAATDNADTVVGYFLGSTLTVDQPPTIICPVNITIQCSASTLPANTGTPSAFDPDGPTPTLTYTDVIANGSCPQNHVITRTWTATDACAHTVMCSHTITLVDTAPPVISCPPNVTVDCAASTLPASTGNLTATDLCDPSPTIAHTDVILPGACPAEFTVRRTWSATDHCGNNSTCLQTITLDDNTSPVIMCIDQSIVCSESISPDNPHLGYPSVSNNCGGTNTLTYSDVFVYMASNPQCSIIRTWTATDNCGNSSTCNQFIIVKDFVNPTLFCPVNVTIACSASTLPGNTGSATATDNCSIFPGISYTDAITISPTCIQDYSISRTWKATDECGNSVFCTQSITVVDNTVPTITCPVNVTIACTASTLPASTGTATAIDNCSTLAITSTDVVVTGACPQETIITRKWKAQDACGNSSTCNQIITVHDALAPSMSCPANVTIQCTASILPASTGTATATDNCSTFAITSTDVVVVGSCPQRKTITRTWKATDACGNFNTCNQIITVDDTSPPSVTCPVNVTIDCAASTLPANTGTASASDNCSTFAVTSTDVVVTGICPQEKTITRTWKATDACGNFSTCNQIITIHDSTPPAISCPANVTIECTANTLPANTGTSTAIDNCSTFLITFSDVIVAGGCPQEKVITRTWKATDACTNFSTCIQIITVDDSTPPVISCPPNMTIECTANTLPANTGSASAVDNCSTLSISSTDVILPGDCPQEKTIIRNWKATDACGNISSCNQTITVDDSTHPTMTCPVNVTVECTASTLPANTGTATATDNCSTFGITSTDVITAGSCPQEKTITRTWKTTDACGNSTTCIQTIFVDDSTPPLISCPSDVTVQCVASTLPEQTGSATSTDNCDVAPVVTYTDVTMSGPTPHGYSIIRTWTGTDACGNNSTCIQHLQVENPLDPSITGLPTDTICSGDIEMFQAQNQGLGSVTYQWNFGSGASPPTASGIGPHTVTYTYNGTNGTTGAWVLLTVSFPGCASVTDTVSNIHVNPIPNADISYTPPGSPCVLQSMSFQPQSAQMPGFTYDWNFGAGANIPSAMGYGPHSVEYFTSGPKTVQLIVFAHDAGASCGDTTTTVFTVNTCPGNITGRVFKSDGTPIQGVNLRLFADQNLDGIQDNPNNIIKSAFTNASGNYLMTILTPGYYVIVEIQPNGFFSLYDEDASEDFDSLSNLNPNDNILPVTIEPMETDSNNYFVEVSSPGIISGYVFEDFNGNEMPGSSEGIQNVTVQLFHDDDQNGAADPGAPIATTTTSSLGFYTFGGLALGNYVIVEQQPSGYISVKDFDATNDLDNVPNTNTTDDIIPVTLINGETDANNYFIEYSACPQMVTNANDSGPGSLRYVLDCTGDGDTILFAASMQNQTIHLTSSRIEINSNLYIYSGLTPRVKIQSDIPGAFLIDAGFTAEFKNIDFVSGLSGYPGAVFENHGNLILWDATITRNALLLPNNPLIYNTGAAMMTVKGGIMIDNQ